MTQVAAKTTAMNAKRWKPPSAPSWVAGEKRMVGAVPWLKQPSRSTSRIRRTLCAWGS